MTIAQRTSSSAYDELGAVRTSTDFAGLVTASAYDRAGRAGATFEDPDGAEATAAYQTGAATYDPTGRVLTAKDQRQVNNAGLGTTASTYDELGRTLNVTEASGTGGASVTRSTWDALDREVTSTVGYGGPAPQVTTTTYDLGGRATSVDDGFACTASTYDYRDLVGLETTGLAGGTCTKAAGTEWRETTHSYDGLGREYRAEVSGVWTGGPGLGDRSLDATFDAAGHTLTAATRTGGVTATTTFTVNLLGQTLAEARPDGSTNKATFDPAGNPADACYWKSGIAVGACLPATTPLGSWTNPPTTVVTTTYDGRGNRYLQTTASPAGNGMTGTTAYNPDADYAPAATYLATKMSPTTVLAETQTTYTYETTEAVRRNRLVGQATRLCVGPSADHASCTSSTALGSSTYAYDENDNVTVVTEDNTGGAVTRYYCYDARNQLATRRTGSSCASSPIDETYTYDPTGKIIAPTSGGGLVTGLTATTDSAGMTIALSGGATNWTYAYDAEGRLTSVCKTASCAADRVDFTYDGAGHRIQVRTTAAGVVTTLDIAYDGDAPVQERINGVVSRTYVTDETGRIVRFCDPDCTAGNPVYAVAWNAHGDAVSVSQIDPATGAATIANRYAYATWGTPTVYNGAGTPIGWSDPANLRFRYLYVGAADVQWDDSIGQGLLYMHARTYSPTLGRFLQPDPARVDPNLYAYAENSPITKSDPTGLGGPAGKPGLTPYAIGKIAERHMVREVELAGWRVTNVQFRGYLDGARVVDIRAVRGNWLAIIEVKGNTGSYSVRQFNNDLRIVSQQAAIRGVRNVGAFLARVDVHTSGPLIGKATTRAVRPVAGARFGSLLRIGGGGGGGRRK